MGCPALRKMGNIFRYAEATALRNYGLSVDMVKPCPERAGRHVLTSAKRGVEQRQLGGFMTRRPAVRFRPPAITDKKKANTT